MVCSRAQRHRKKRRDTNEECPASPDVPREPRFIGCVASVPERAVVDVVHDPVALPEFVGDLLENKFVRPTTLSRSQFLGTFSGKYHREGPKDMEVAEDCVCALLNAERP
jgi:hypothetical protein